MKRFALILAAVFMTFSGCFAQEFTEEDAKQFYRTIQGDYVMQVNDSTTAMVHFTPIWEKMGNRFQWMYVEATIDKNVVFQKVLEVQPKSSTKFTMLSQPAALFNTTVAYCVFGKCSKVIPCHS